MHPNQVTQWRRRLIQQVAIVFAGQPAEGSAGASDREILLAKIG